MENSELEKYMVGLLTFVSNSVKTLIGIIISHQNQAEFPPHQTPEFVNSSALPGYPPYETKKGYIRADGF